MSYANALTSIVVLWHSCFPCFRNSACRQLSVRTAGGTFLFFGKHRLFRLIPKLRKHRSVGSHMKSQTFLPVSSGDSFTHAQQYMILLYDFLFLMSMAFSNFFLFEQFYPPFCPNFDRIVMKLVCHSFVLF